MSKIKIEPYVDRKVMVSASDLATLVAYRWDGMRALEEQGFDVLAKDLQKAGDRCRERLYKSGYWTE